MRRDIQVGDPDLLIKFCCLQRQVGKKSPELFYSTVSVCIQTEVKNGVLHVGAAMCDLQVNETHKFIPRSIGHDLCERLSCVKNCAV